MDVLCDYCKQPAQRVNGAELYPHRQDLHERIFYQCKPCDAYVGTHKRSGKPYGGLANRELRMERRYAHEALDLLWQHGYFLKRTDAYAWLAAQLKIPVDACHIGQFNASMCQRVVVVSRNYQRQLNEEKGKV